MNLRVSFTFVSLNANTAVHYTVVICKQLMKHRLTIKDLSHSLSYVLLHRITEKNNGILFHHLHHFIILTLNFSSTDIRCPASSNYELHASKLLIIFKIIFILI